MRKCNTNVAWKLKYRALHFYEANKANSSILKFEVALRREQPCAGSASQSSRDCALNRAAPVAAAFGAISCSAVSQ